MSQEASSKGVVRRAFHKAKFGQDKFVLVQTTRIHYVEAGKGEPLVLVPGAYSAHRTWDHLIPLLAKEYRILVLDLEGIRQDYSPQEQADLMAKIIQQLDLGKVSLMGGSQSGRVIFYFAVHYPELLNTIVSLGGGVIQLETKLESSSPKSWYKLGLTRKTTSHIEEQAKSIKCPTLYLYGTKSDPRGTLLKKNLEYLTTYLPQTWIVALEGRIRDLAMLQPSEITSIILEFLRKKPSR